MDDLFLQAYESDEDRNLTAEQFQRKVLAMARMQIKIVQDTYEKLEQIESKLIGDPMLSVSDLAKRWGVSKQAIYNLTSAGTIPEPRKIGIKSRWPLSEIRQFENQTGRKQKDESSENASEFC